MTKRVCEVLTSTQRISIAEGGVVVALSPHLVEQASILRSLRHVFGEDHLELPGDATDAHERLWSSSDVLDMRVLLAEHGWEFEDEPLGPGPD